MIKKVSTLVIGALLSMVSYSVFSNDDVSQDESNHYDVDKSTTISNEQAEPSSPSARVGTVAPFSTESKTIIDEEDRSLASDSILEIMSENELNAKDSADGNSHERDQLLLDKAKARQKKALEANKNPEHLDEDMLKLRQEANAEYHRNEGNEKISKANARKVAKAIVGTSDDKESEKSLSSSFSKISQSDDNKKDKNKKTEDGKKIYQKKTDALMNAFK